MSSLPKSIHWCRRYSTKFNSGWDIPFVDVWTVNCQNNGGNFVHGVPGVVTLIAQDIDEVNLEDFVKVKNVVPGVTATLDVVIDPMDDPCPIDGTPGKDKFTMIPNSLEVIHFSGAITSTKCDKDGICSGEPESVTTYDCTRIGDTIDFSCTFVTQ